MINSFDKVISEYNFSWKLSDILPKVLVAGEEAGVLTEKGAGMLDPTGALKPGARFCPPEGDAGTRDDCDKQCCETYRKCFRRNICVCDGCS